MLLANLEREKELLRVFLKVSQMENKILRRMNLSSFLMVSFGRCFTPRLIHSEHYANRLAVDEDGCQVTQATIHHRPDHHYGFSAGPLNKS